MPLVTNKRQKENRKVDQTFRLSTSYVTKRTPPQLSTAYTFKLTLVWLRLRYASRYDAETSRNNSHISEGRWNIVKEELNLCLRPCRAATLPLVD